VWASRRRRRPRQEWPHEGAGDGQDGIRRERDKLRDVFANKASVASAKAILNAQIAADNPTQFLHPLKESRDTRQHLRIVSGERSENGYAFHALALLRTRHRRPRRRAA
jgi:hypothetical protein